MGVSDHDERLAPDGVRAKDSLQNAGRNAAGKSRLSEALRANLNRRKAQSRARAVGESGSGAALPSEAGRQPD